MVAYNCLISVMAQCHWDFALLILGEMHTADVITYNAVISACAAGSCWQAALSFLMMARDELVECDVESSVDGFSGCRLKSFRSFQDI